METKEQKCKMFLENKHKEFMNKLPLIMDMPNIESRHRERDKCIKAICLIEQQLKELEDDLRRE